MRCAAVVGYESGVVRALLILDPPGPLNGEHISTNLRNVELISGEFYEVTFKKIATPDLSLG
jgi:hypothetical protein